MRKCSKLLGIGLPLLLVALVGLFKSHTLFSSYSSEIDHHYPIPEKDKSFVFIVPAYNCTKLCKKTLSSIFEQTYRDFRVFFIDDGSTDNTFSKAQKFVKNTYPDAPVTLIKNEARKGTLQNIYEIVTQCEDHEIIMVMEGNCWLSHKHVLKQFNDLYKSRRVWIAYAQHLDKESHRIGKCKKVSARSLFSHSMRRKYWERPRIKSFYAGLFKKIRLDDLLFGGKCIDENIDKAYMFPMLEMAGKHMDFIPDVLCVQEKNRATDETAPSSSSPRQCLLQITQASPYPLLRKHPASIAAPIPLPSLVTDLVVFSYDRPMQLLALLESVKKHAKGLRYTSVIYRCSDDRYADAYDDLQKVFPKVRFIKQSDKPYEDFKPLVMQTIFDKSANSAPFVALASDDVVLHSPIDFSICTEAIHRTNGYFFALGLGTHINYNYALDKPIPLPYSIAISDSMIGWQLSSAKSDWSCPPYLEMTIYKKSELHETLSDISFKNPYQMEKVWNSYYKPFTKKKKGKRVGLCFKEAKAINIPLNLTHATSNRSMNLYSTEELLRKYEQGLKIDIKPIFQKQHCSIYFEHEPRFIPR